MAGVPTQRLCFIGECPIEHPLKQFGSQSRICLDLNCLHFKLQSKTLPFNGCLMLEVPKLTSLFEFAFPKLRDLCLLACLELPPRWRNPVHRFCLKQSGMQELAVILPILLSPAGLCFGASSHSTPSKFW